jgi:hypothetical protein
LLHQFNRDVADETFWLEEKLPLAASPHLGASLSEVQSLQQKHLLLEADIQGGSLFIINDDLEIRRIFILCLPNYQLLSPYFLYVFYFFCTGPKFPCSCAFFAFSPYYIYYTLHFTPIFPLTPFFFRYPSLPGEI